jgi:hypothetical protein
MKNKKKKREKCERKRKKKKGKFTMEIERVNYAEGRGSIMSKKMREE